MTKTHVIAGVLCSALGILIVNILVLPPRLALHVTTEVVKPASLALMVRASGTLEAKASVALRIPFEAKVVRKSFKEGDKVQAQQELLVSDREKIRLDYQSRKDALTNAQADLSRTHKDLRLQKTLFHKQAVAYSAVEDAQRALVRAEQAVRAAKEAFRLETERWNSNVLRAPFAGTVVRDGLGDDTSITAGKDLVIIADVSEYTVRVNVDELDIKQVVVGQSADIRIPLYPQTVFKARVTQIGTSSDNQGPGIPEIPVVLRLENTQGMLLRPKLTTEARIFTTQTEPVLSVPRDAIDNTQGSPRIWRVGRWKRLQPVAVTLGRSTLDRIETPKGLVAGWRIIDKAKPEFKPGMRVEDQRR